MKQVIIKLPEIDYVLVHWEENSVTPWVAAWAYNEDNGCWGQGHYFVELADAIKYLAKKLEEKRK